MKFIPHKYVYTKVHYKDIYCNKNLEGAKISITG